MQAPGSPNSIGGLSTGDGSRHSISARPSMSSPNTFATPSQFGRSPSFGHFKAPQTPRTDSSFRSASRSTAQLVDVDGGTNGGTPVAVINQGGPQGPGPAMTSPAAPPVLFFSDIGASSAQASPLQGVSTLNQVVNAQGQSSGDSNLNLGLSSADIAPPDSSSDTGSSSGAAPVRPTQDAYEPPAEAMFKDLDPDKKGTIGMKELRRAVARFVGQREVSESDCLDVVERLNAIQPKNDKIDPSKITLSAFRKVLDAIHPNDFAVQARLKEWFTSLNILDAFAQEAEKFVVKDGVHHRDALLEVSKLSNAKVVHLCDKFRERIGPLMEEAVQRLKTMSSPSYDATQTNDKFAMMDDAFTGNFAEVDQFFKGLDGHIGLPSPRVKHMMELEHTQSADSHDEFITSNYGGTETWPALEWEFVMNPDISKDYPGIIRQPQPLDDFINHDIAIEAGLEDTEVIALRLFTGPMFMKYNAKLRNFPPEGVEALKGNGYVTTIHAVVSAVIKLSRIWKLPHDRKVYRGLGGMVLPEKFWKEDQFGCRGGVEFALMSTTIKRDVAIQYSGAEKGRPTIFEIEVGQVDRGASLSWVSQYPMEEEIVMPPLSNLEVVGDARMEESDQGLIMVIPLRINVNLKSLTMDELRERRKLLHLSMMGNLQQEAQRDLMEAASTQQLGGDKREETVRGMMADFNKMMDKVRDTDADEFNNDEYYKSAMTSALDMKRGTLRKFEHLHSEKMQQVLPEVQQRIEESNCQDWARDGTVFRIISNTNAFPWEAVAEGKLTEVELPLTLTREQAAVAWEAIKANVEGHRPQDTPEVEYVTISGLGGKTAKIKAREAISGYSFALRADRMRNNRATTEPHGVDEQGIRVLLPIFRMNLSFVRIDLSKSTIGVELARELSEQLAENTDLKYLKIRGPIQVDRARNYADFDMSVRNSRGPPAPAGSFRRVASTRTGNSALNRTGSGTGPGMAANGRAQTITRGQRMTIGRETWEPCDVEGGIVLAAFIAHNVNITRLDLEGNRIGPDGATALAETLPRVRELRFLNLRDNNICAEGATAVSKALVEHGAIQLLDVRDNRTGAQGPNELAPAVQANVRLEELNGVEIVGGEGGAEGSWKVSQLTDPAYEMVFVARQIINRNNDFVITSLDFENSQLGFEGAKLLGPALKACVNLQHLILRGNALRSNGGRQIAPALKACTNLRTLDLSHNLIEDATAEVADALRGHPSLHSLLYIGNIKEGFIEWELCFTRWRHPYKLLASAVPRCSVTFFTKQQKINGLLSWCFITIASLCLCAGFVGTPYFLLRLDYIYAFGFMGLGVFGLLGVSGWVVSRRLLRRMGIINCFVRCVQRQSMLSSAVNVPSDMLQDESSHGRRSSGMEGVNGDVVFSPVPENTMNVNGTVAFSADSSMEMQPVHALHNGAGRQNVMQPGADAEPPHAEEGEDEAHDETNEWQNIQSLFGENLKQQVPMLLEQYVSNTMDPASLDEELHKKHQHKQDFWTVGQFMHSSKPVALALRKPVVKLLVVFLVFYYAGVFMLFLWPWMFGEISYRTFRFDTLQYRNGLPATMPSIDSFAVGGFYCDGAFNGKSSVVRNSVVLEFDDPVTVGRLKVVTGTNDPAEDPRVFQLLGCDEAYAECDEWEDITGNMTDDDFPLERTTEVWYDVEEAWQLTLLRFVPFFFGLGFMVLLYCSMANLHEYGRLVLICTFAFAALPYAIASTPNDNTSQRMRWLPAGMMSFFPLMLLYREKYFVHGVVLYGLLYVPMIMLIAPGMFLETTLPQWSKSLNWENYDQLTIMPLALLSNLMLLPLLAQYALYRARIKLLVEGDTKEYHDVWARLSSNVEALRDLKGEVDKFSTMIEQRTVSVRHAVSSRRVADDEDESARSGEERRRSRHLLSRMLPYPRLTGDAHEEGRITSLLQVYAQAGGVDLLLKKKVQSWALLSGGWFPRIGGGFVHWKTVRANPRAQREIMWGELKDRARAIDKVLRFYDGDVSKVLDICRQTIVFDNIEHLSHCVAVMRQDKEVQVVRVKNRMDPEEQGGGEHASKVYAGYRDVALNLKFKTEEAETLGIDGHVCEVRLVYKELAQMLQGQRGQGRHQRYIEYRNSRGS